MLKEIIHTLIDALLVATFQPGRLDPTGRPQAPSRPDDRNRAQT